ncbi:MAG: MFS transporter [Ruminiclostridium sp.]|nr:MFS transporter [Ruminiclostridium sp.]
MRVFFNKMNFDNKALFIIFEGIAYTIVLNIYNPFILMFAKRMGAGDFHIALLNSIPPLIAVFVLIPCSILIEKANRKKRTTSLMIFLNSIFYAVIAFVPFIPGQAKVMVYILLIGFMNWPGSLYVSTWQSFFADTFSGSNANYVYSLRSKYSAFFGLLAALFAGLILTEIPRNDTQRLFIYQAFYIACFVITLLQLYFLSRVRQESAGPVDSRQTVSVSFKLSSFKEIFRNKGFMVFCLCTFLFHISWQMGWPLFFLYNVDHAGLNEFQIGMISVVAGVSSFFSYSIWSRFIEKKGTRFVIIIGALGLALNPIFFTSLLSFYAIILVNVLAGFSGAGFTYTLFCSLLETLPENKKTIYISLFNTFINVSGFISPFLGIWLYKLTGIYTAMLIIAVLRLLASSFYIIRWWTGKKSMETINNTLEA